MLENLEERWLQGFISEGQTVCQTCYLAKSQAEQEVLKVHSSSISDIVCLTNQMTCGHMNVQGKKPASSDAGEFCLDDRVKQTALKENPERISNMEFDWVLDYLTEHKSIPNKALIHKAPSKMMCSNTAGQPDSIADMLKAAGEGVELAKQLPEAPFSNGEIPADWEIFILDLYRDKGWSPWQWQLSQSQAHRLSHEAAGIGARFLYLQDGENWWDAVLLLCLVEAPLKPSSLFTSCRSGRLVPTNYITLPSSNLRKPWSVQ